MLANCKSIVVLLGLGIFFVTGASMADTDSAVPVADTAAPSADAPVATAAVPVADSAEAGTGIDGNPTPPTPVTPSEPATLKSEIPKAKMPDIKVTVSPQKGAIGDLIEWRVEVKKKAPGDQVVLPSTFDFGELEIQSRTVKGATEDEQSMTQVLGIGLISFEMGEFEVPPQKLTVVDAKGNITEVMSPAFKVTISSQIANEPEPAIKLDEKNGETVMVDDYTLLYVAIGLGAVLVIVLLTLLIRKLLSMRKPKPGPPPPPPRPAHEVALEKLNAIKNAGYLDEQMHKTFHLKLSEAFREYLGNRYHFDALERSTREIVDELRALQLKLELHREIVQLLEDTDLVKFAKYIPPKEESERLLDEAVRLVQVTCRKPVAAGSTEATQVDGGRK
ncbi:MAG: hypothetical protein JXX14_05495 [Deltaproteobacteria bacterium]|nr:hypothetical protein [Deltaproteobacteria bacterium]